MKFPVGMEQEPLNVTKALYVFYRESGIRKADGPVVTTSGKYGDLALRTAGQHPSCIRGSSFSRHKSPSLANCLWMACCEQLMLKKPALSTPTLSWETLALVLLGVNGR